MKIRILFIMSFAMLAYLQNAAAVDYANKIVVNLQAKASADCFYFTLEGVAGWFAVPRSSVGAKDAYALILSARLTNTPINISSNTIAATCNGYPEASLVWM